MTRETINHEKIEARRAYAWACKRTPQEFHEIMVGQRDDEVMAWKRRGQ